MEDIKRETAKNVSDAAQRSSQLAAERGRRFAPRRAVATTRRSAVAPSTPKRQSEAIFAPDTTLSAPSTVNVQSRQKIVADVARPKKQRVVPTVKPGLPRQHKSLVLKRQIVERAVKQQHLQGKQKKRRFKLYAATGAAVLLAGALFVMFLPFGPNGTVNEQAAVSGTLAAIDGANPANLEESAVTLEMIESYEVPVDQPRVLTYQRLGLRSRIVPVDKNLNGEPMVPSNIYDIGWSKSSALPGFSGAALLNGSVIGGTQEGVFRVLGRAAEGDIIQIENGDGSKRNFSVIKVVQYDSDAVDLAALEQPIDPERPGLNLIAMQGRFNARTNQFEQRVAVFAALVE